MSTRKQRRRKASPVARVRPFWLLIAVLAAVAAGAGYWAATWPGFFPGHVAVSGNRAVPAEEIAARAGIRAHENIWLQNTRAAAARVEQIPYIAAARVHRSLPANVRIDVTERVPFAVLRYGPHAVVVDRDLRVLQTGEGAEALPAFAIAGDALPVPAVYIKDPNARRLRDDYGVLADAHVAAARLSFDRFGDLIVTMRGGVRLLLGDDADLQQKATLVGPILSQVAAQGRKIAAVDLRAPKTPVVVYKHNQRN